MTTKEQILNLWENQSSIKEKENILLIDNILNDLTNGVVFSMVPEVGLSTTAAGVFQSESPDNEKPFESHTKAKQLAFSRVLRNHQMVSCARGGTRTHTTFVWGF